MENNHPNYSPVQTGNGGTLSEEAFAIFQAQFKGKILRKEDEAYEEARKIWNGMIDKRPGLIVYCTGVADVVAAVNFAQENSMLTAVRSGGHNVSGSCICDDGIVVDLSQMNAVWVDPKRKAAKAQGGALWVHVDRETQAFGLMTPGGVVSDTGVAGLTLSGGLSWTRRKYGLTIDNMLSVDLVTADGRFLTASETENPDLFWAVRGGGGNFGIVTSFEFQLHQLGPEVMLAATMYPMEEAEKVFDFWLDFMKDAPNEITVDLGLWSIPDHPAFPPEFRNRPIVALFGVYAGDAAEGEKALQAIREVTTPVLDLSGRMPYTAAQSAFDFANPKAEFLNYWKSIYVNEISKDLKKIVLDRALNRPADSALIFIRPFGGAVDAVSTKGSAFGQRDQFLISIDTTWKDRADTEKCIAWTKAFWDQMLPFSEGKTYFGFAGGMDEVHELVADSFRENHERLAEVKTKYDPNNFFRLNQNIKPAAKI